VLNDHAIFLYNAYVEINEVAKIICLEQCFSTLVIIKLDKYLSLLLRDFFKTHEFRFVKQSNVITFKILNSYSIDIIS
jgi:hypothetical protein